MQVVKQSAREIAKHMTTSAQMMSTLPVGRHGLNSFYCWNYLAPLHADKDHSYTISITTAKSGPHYNFCYARWGIIIKTEPGCIW